MKYINSNRFRLKYIVIGLMIISIQSCSKSFTDASANLQGQPAAVELWRTATDAQSAVNSIYGNLRSYNNLGFPALAIECTGSDDEDKGSTANDATYLNLYNNFTVTATEGQLDGFWKGQYQNINFCNQVLDHVDTMAAVAAADKTRFLAEAKFVRAFSYFRLVRAYGRVPLVLHVPLPDSLNPVQSESEVVYDAIEQDLTDAALDLPLSVSADQKGRATKGAALALHAKVAMYRKEWSEAADYSNQVISSGQYALFANYYQQFRIANENNSESIFEVQANFVLNNSDISNCQYSQIQGNRDAQAGYGFNVPTTGLISEFETNDPRLQATVMMAGTTTPSGDVVPAATAGAPIRYNMKTYVPFAIATATNQGADQNFRALRYADVLLINAEANNELGNTAAALGSLEMVRARARALSANPATTLPPVTTTDQTALRNAIWHERRVELAMENDRYFDVIRQGRGAIIFGPLGWKTNKNEVWPIPQAEIDNSAGVLIQNTGY